MKDKLITVEITIVVRNFFLEDYMWRSKHNDGFEKRTDGHHKQGTGFSIKNV